MASQEIARVETPQLPDLVRTPACEITADDIAIPRVKVGSYSSRPVQEDLVQAGDIFTVTSSDDDCPIVLVPKGDEDGVTFYVLTLEKGLSYSDKDETGGELLRWRFGDPEAHPKSWVTYNYLIAIPDVDTDVPFKLLLTRSGKNTATMINTVIKRNAGKAPAHEFAFKLTAAARSNEKGKWFVFRAKQVEVDPKHTEVVRNLAIMASTPATRPVADTTSDQPEI